MIRDTSLSDVIVDKKKALTPRTRMMALAGLVVFVLVSGTLVHAYAAPWLRADRTVSSDRLRLATVTRGKFEHSISVQGTVDAAVRPTLYSSAQGVVMLRVKAGDRVTKSQVLAEVVSPELESEFKQEQSRLQQMKSDLDLLRITTKQQKLANQEELALQEIELVAARRGFERADQAMQKNAIARMDFDAAKDKLDASDTKMNHSRARIALEQERLDFELRSKELEVQRYQLMASELERQVADLQILSPTDGLVGSLLVKDRDNVSLNTEVMTVVNLDAFEVLVSIPESYADALTPQMRARIAAPGRELAGTLASVSPEVIDGHVEGRVMLDEDVTRILKQKQRVTVKIVLDSRENALMVARGPFIEDGAGRVAYVVDGNLASSRAIKTGAVGVSTVEILGGLQEGEQVIISSISGFEQAEKVLIR
jgi:HlyD family secretion protein